MQTTQHKTIRPGTQAAQAGVRWGGAQAGMLALTVMLLSLPGIATAASYNLNGSVGNPGNYPPCIGGSWSGSGNERICSGRIELVQGDSIVPDQHYVLMARGGMTLKGDNRIGSESQPLELRTDWGPIRSEGSNNLIYGDLRVLGWGAIELSRTEVFGRLETKGTVTLDKTTVAGSVTTQNGVSADESSVTGEILASSGSITLRKSRVAGDVRSDCCAITLDEVELTGNVRSNSNEIKVSDSRIEGNLDSPGNSIKLEDDTLVVGNVTAGGWSSSLSIDNSSQVNGVCTPTHPRCGAAAPPEPVAYWSMNQSGADGEVLDASGNGLDGKMIGNTRLLDALPAIPGNPGSCAYASFDGRDSGISIGEANLQLGRALTVTAWLKWEIDPKTGASWANIVSYNATSGSGDNGLFWLQHNSNNSNLEFAVQTSSGRRFVQASVPTAQGQWQHVAGVFDGARITIYIDGVARGNVSHGGSFGVTTGRALSIGRWSNPGNDFRRFTGNIDEVRIFNKALSADDVVANMKRSQPCSMQFCGSMQVIHGLPKMEVAAFTVINTYSKPVPTTVNFSQNFDRTPLVFTLPTVQGGDPAAHRIRNVTRSGFEIMTVEPESEDGPHVEMGLNFLAIEPGLYVLPDGHRLEACLIETTKAQQSGAAGEWENLEFLSSFARPPALLGQIQTMHNETGNIPSGPSIPWLTTAISNATPAGVKIALERSETASGSINTPERIAYLAAEPTAGRKQLDIAGHIVDYEIIRSDPVIRGWSNGCAAINYSSPWTDPAGRRIRPVPLASMNTRGGDAEAGEDDGGWMRRCTESVNNESSRIALLVDEIRRGAFNRDGNRSKSEPERAGVFVFSDNFVTQAVNLHHLEFEHASTGATCAPVTVRLRACEDAGCSTPYTGNVTIDLKPTGGASSWSGPGVMADQVEFTGGSVELQLRHTKEGSVRLDALGTPKAASAVVCRTGGVLSDCRIAFSNSALVFDVPDIIAGRPTGSVDLRVVQSDSNDPSRCTPALSGRRDVHFGSQYANPASGTHAVEINGSAISTSDTGTPIALEFDADGHSRFELRYADAGQLRLWAKLTGNKAEGEFVIEGSDDFVSRPAGYCLMTDLPDCDAADVSCPIAAVAGDEFKLALVSVAWERDDDKDLCTGNPTTPNYRHNGIQLAAELIAPSNGQDATLGVNRVDMGAAESGNFTAAQRISEVGVFRLHAEAPAGSYFGHTIPPARTAPLGRFVPARLQVTGNSPLLASACSSAFTFLGQRFEYLLEPQIQVTGLNRQGEPTRNYHGAFWRLNLALAGQTHADATAQATLEQHSAGNVSWSGADVPDLDASATISGVELSYRKPDEALAPFDGRIHLDTPASAFTDADGKCFDPADNGSCASFRFASIAAGQMRWGRLDLGGAHQHQSSEEAAVTVRSEHFDGGGFVLNADDNCSKLTQLAHIELENSQESNKLDGRIAIGEGVTELTGGLGQFVSGLLTLQFSAPGPGNSGFVDILPKTAEAGMPWLNSNPAPRGRIEWGMYSGPANVIHIREIWR